MKIVYFGSNIFSSCLNYLINEGHDILCVYKSKLSLNTCNIDQTCRKNIPQYTHKPNITELNRLIAEGAEMFFVAEYPYLLAMTNVKYAINMHSSLLPIGRGPTPLPHLITRPQYSGLTLHKIASKFDSGDIILQAKVKQNKGESLTTLMVKMRLESVKLLTTLFKNLERYYHNASPQKNDTYWPAIKTEERMLDWSLSVSQLHKLISSLGYFGVIVKLNQNYYKVTHVEVSVYQHNSTVGTVLFEDGNLLVISVLDGFACIHKNSISTINNRA